MDSFGSADAAGMVEAVKRVMEIETFQWPDLGGIRVGFP